MVVSVAGAVVIAVMARTPGDPAATRPGPGVHDASLGAHFTDEQIARHGSYRAPMYALVGISTLVSLSLLVLLARGPWAGFVDRIGGAPGGWVVLAFVAAASLTLLSILVALPLAYVKLRIDQAWGISTQDLTGWSVDRGKSAAVGVAIGAIAACAFYGVVRAAPTTWWLWGWGVFSALTGIMFLLYPVVIAPLFNTFTSLPEGELRAQILQLGEEAGVPLDDVLVADASRRTTAENAYVAGIGPTKRMVLYDTLLDSGTPEETLFVAAHELGHRRESHILKGLVMACLGLFVGFALLKWLSGVAAPWRWAGANGVGDLRALPVLLLFSSLLTLVVTPVQNAASRAMERDADRIAVDLTDDPEPAVSSFRRLAFSNLSDLRPPAALVALLYTHPPIRERIERALQRSEEIGAK